MNQYVCVNCNALYNESELENNIDGTCDWCGYPLEIFKSESPTIENKDLNTMVYQLQHYSQKEIWSNIELLRDAFERIKERKIFFKALQMLHKNFSI